MARFATALLLTLLLGGCSLVFDPGAHTGGGTDGGTMDGSTMDGAAADGGGMIPLADLCRMVSEAYCENAERCCTLDADPMPMFDTAMCMTEVRGQCATAYGQTSARDEINYDPAAAYESFQRGLALLEACDVGIQDFQVQRDGFFAGVTGTIAGGVDCTPDDEMDETELTIAVLSCTGGQVCQRIARGDWRCSLPGNDGATCTQAFDCMSGRCEQANLIAPRMCGMGEASGSPCFLNQECRSLTCAWNPTVRRLECAEQTPNNVYCVYLDQSDG